MRRASLIFLGAVAGFCVSQLAGRQDLALIDAQAKPAASAQAGVDTQGLALFKKVLDRVRTDYVEKPDDMKLIESAIRGMLASLDPHSNYMDARSYRDMQTETRGEFGGVGIRVTMEDGLIKVVDAIEETPAAKAGIRVDDIITQLDGEPLKGLPLNEVVDKMRGPVNSKVRLLIRRKGEAEPVALSMVRELIKVRSVEFHSEGGDVGYIRLKLFNYQATDGLRQAIKGLSQGAGLKGYILDLRNNPGGLIDQAASVAGVFLDEGEVLSLRGRYADDDEHFSARSGSGDLTKGKPVIVLINGGSASSAEIVAGALQDLKRATVVGTRSYGKGSVQTVIPLGAGNGALRLTTARYFTPAGRSIQAQGIKPDIEVLQEVPKELDASADMPGEATLPGHLKADGEERTGSQSFVPADPTQDKALHAALALLRGSPINSTAPSARAGAPD